MVIEYLEQLERESIIINDLKDEIETLRTMAQSVGAISYDGEKVQGSHNNDRLTNIMNNYIDLEDELQDRLLTYNTLKKNITNNIKDNVKDVKQFKVLYSKYVSFKPFYEIANEMGISHKWVHELHRRGLEHIIVPKSS